MLTVFSEGRWEGRGQDFLFLSLKADESLVGQNHEYAERKWKYYYFIIFPAWKDLKFYIKKEEDKKTP